MFTELSKLSALISTSRQINDYHTFKGKLAAVNIDHGLGVSDMCLNKTRPHELVTTSFDCTFNTYDAEKLKLLHNYKAHEKGIWCCDHSGAVKLLALGSNDNSISLWSTDSSAYHKVGSITFHEEVVSINSLSRFMMSSFHKAALLLLLVARV